MTISRLRHDFIHGLPKAELHLHIEGSLEPELMFALAQRNNVRLPYASVDEVRAAYDFSDLQSFFIGLFVLSALFPVSFQKVCKLTFQDGATMRRQQR